MRDVAPRNDHEATLAWADLSLVWAHSRSRTRLVEFLNLVQTEILFEMDSSEGRRSTRNRASRADHAPGPNRGI